MRSGELAWTIIQGASQDCYRDSRREFCQRVSVRQAVANGTDLTNPKRQRGGAKATIPRESRHSALKPTA